jgi:hypothetical protein
MKVPKGKKVYTKGRVYSAGDELPDDLAEKIKLKEKDKPKSLKSTNKDESKGTNRS